MAIGPFGRISRLIETVFPERQFYHRSHGEVRFISLSAGNQIALIVLLFFFLAWVAFASVNVVFKEQIISAKERNLIAVHQQYDVRLSEMQKAYDEVNALLTIAAERFSTQAERLNTYHEELESYVNREADLNQRLAILRDQLNEGGTTRQDVAQTSVFMRAAELEPTPLQSRPLDKPKTTELADLAQRMQIVTAAREEAHRPAIETTNRVQEIEASLSTLSLNHQQVMTELEERTVQSVLELEAFIESTGLPLETVMARFERRQIPVLGEGGPLIELDGEDAFQGELELSEQTRRRHRLDQKIDQLSALQEALSSIPLARPTTMAVRMTSNFGPRKDPFTRRVAFHSGIDFAGPRGTPIRATQTGTVVYAGPRGAYGRFVEIDHGNGFRTRYAHMHRIRVKVGQKVEFGQKIGTIGSTGRSTGPHLHYELWFDGRVQNPANFIEAGQYVFKG